ncbi:hypothetical protein BDA96_10G342200 [Sorghum bicolor]|uniref:FLZ-type domain-containing protein n=1 Tax=Sorghum bicolor TaxID=4558 RepID=A0A921U316_SORBI|nr:hypothetical protein BDA96_10G342200 [Sorghum bicolor]
MKETNKVTAEAMEEEEEEEEEERYVKVGTRFYRVTMRPNGGGGAGDAVARRRRRLHYLESCYLCKQSIACDRDVFMYKGDAAFCSEDCRDDQMDMDEALHAAARRHRLLQRSPASASSQSSQAAASTRPPPVMRRRPTIANLAARNPPVAAS